MKERREYLRISAALPVTHRLRGVLIGITSMSEDISTGGVSFTTVQKIDPGMVLNLDIALPGFKKPVSVGSQVVWRAPNKDLSSERFLLGARFIGMDDGDKHKVAEYIRLQTIARRDNREHTGTYGY